MRNKLQLIGPHSLTAQTIMLIAVGLTAAYLLGLFHYSKDRLDALVQLSLRNAAQTAAHMTHAIRASNEEWRSRVLQTMEEPHLKASLSKGPEYSNSSRLGEYEEIFREHLGRQAHRGELSGALINLAEGEEKWEVVEDGHTIDQMFIHAIRLIYNIPSHLSANVSIPLNNGQWLNITYTIPDFPRNLWSPSLSIVAAMTLAIIALSALSVRRMLSPLSDFAKATRRFALDINAPPMPLDGAVEVRDVATAFNEMQIRLRNLVRNRTEMMAAISHDLRTPLALMKLRVEAYPEAESRSRLLASIDHMESMIATTLDFARQSLEMESRKKIDVHALLQSVCDDAKERGGVLTLNIDDKAMIVSGQPSALRRAIENVVANGLKFGNSVVVSCAIGSDGISITVTDDGPGIPEPELERVFEPFYRGDQSRTDGSDGFGLGLSLVRSIVETHGGQVTLANNSPIGLSVRLFLPFPAECVIRA